MDTKGLIVEGKKIGGGGGSEFLDNFYASLPSRPSQTSLQALHRPDSCQSIRRVNGWYKGRGGGGPSSTVSTYPPASRPMSSRPMSRAVSHNDLTSVSRQSRPGSSMMSRTLSGSNNDISGQSRPRSSLRRSMSNTHLINGFYAPHSEIDKYYAHGPYYENPDNSPYVADGPRIYKSDRHSFFNGKVFTVRDTPKARPPRPGSAAEARALFEPPPPAINTIEHRYLSERRNRVMNESLNLGDSINHVYMPTVSD